MTSPRIRLSPLLFALLAFAALAEDATDASVSFSHGDWELVCDNTGTCRAGGYQSESEGLPVSVLLTRAAGAGTPVSGELTLGEDWVNDTSMPMPAAVSFQIDGRKHGRIVIGKNDASGKLDAGQVKALLAALRRDSRIEFHAAGGDDIWSLSDTGASAVLLKMDDVQGRIGSVGALQRQGKRNESAVPAAKPKPIIRAVGAPPAQRGDDSIATRHDAALRTALRAADPEQECMDLHDTEFSTTRGDEPEQLEIHRLDADHLLVTTRCWLAAYNAGSGYWIVEDAPPFRATLVTTMGNGLEVNAKLVEISAAHKGRGIGDCWSQDAWTWDGTRFVHSASNGSGMCRGFPGGAWPMPSVVTEVVKTAAAVGGKKSR